MTTKPLDLTKPVRYVDAHGNFYPARVICTSRIGEYPIVALVLREGGNEDLRSFNSDGHYPSTRSYLENIPVIRETWENVYSNRNGGSRFDSREKALERAQYKSRVDQDHLGFIVRKFADDDIIDCRFEKRIP